MEGNEPTAVGGEQAALLREIEACDVRLRFLTVAGYDGSRVGQFRGELIGRREKAQRELDALQTPP